MKKAKIACITGVKDTADSESLQKELQDLNFEYKPDLMSSTCLLIVGCVCTQKFKMAKTLQKPIQIVTESWLRKSYERMICQPFEDFQIPSIFYGASIAIWGFNEELTKKIFGKIKENGGNPTKIKHQLKINSSIEFCDWFDAVVMDKKHYRNLLEFRKIDKINTAFVGIEWLQASLEMKVARFPKDYAYNYIKISQNQLPDLTPYIDKFKQKNLFKDPSNLLKGYIVYIDDSIHPKLKSHLKKLICLHNGMHLDFISPVITHMVVDISIDQKDYLSLMKFGNMIPIVRVQWLIQTITSMILMTERDYIIHYFHEKQQHSSHSEISSVTSKNNSLGFRSVSISIHTEKKKKMEFRPYKTTIFKNVDFYLDERVRKEECLRTVVKMIRQNGGIAYSGIKKQCEMYCVLADGPQTENLFRELSRKKGASLVPVSYRWVHYCVKKHAFISPNEHNYFIFKPFKFVIPSSSFLNSKFQIIGVDEILKLRIREVLDELGSRKVRLSNTELTHCLCGQGWNQGKDFDTANEIRTNNEKVKFITLSWLFECMNNGKMLPVDDYVCF